MMFNAIYVSLFQSSDPFISASFANNSISAKTVNRSTTISIPPSKYSKIVTTPPKSVSFSQVSKKSTWKANGKNSS